MVKLAVVWELEIWIGCKWIESKRIRKWIEKKIQSNYWSNWKLKLITVKIIGNRERIRKSKITLKLGHEYNFWAWREKIDWSGNIEAE